MTKKLKYTDIGLSNHVYVSSDGHYNFRVYMKGRKSRESLWYSPGYGGLDMWSEPPKYVWKAIQEAALKAFKSPSTLYYEKYQDGTERYGPYKYHDEIMVQYHIQALECQLGQRAEMDHPYAGDGYAPWTWIEEGIEGDSHRCVQRAITTGYRFDPKAMPPHEVIYAAAKAHLQMVLERDYPKS